MCVCEYLFFFFLLLVARRRCRRFNKLFFLLLTFLVNYVFFLYFYLGFPFTRVILSSRVVDSLVSFRNFHISKLKIFPI